MDEESCYEQEEADSTVGSKLASFYLIYRRLSQLPNEQDTESYGLDLIAAVQAIECHPASEMEPFELLREICLDCQKKCSMMIRNHYQGVFQQCLTSSRQKLNYKVTSNTSKSDSYNRNYRHVLALIELVGSFSNFIMDFAHRYHSSLSRDMFHFIVMPSHDRIVDLIWEYYQQFCVDKNLSSYQTKILNKDHFNVTMLDQLLEQFAQFASTVYRYFNFLHDIYFDEELLLVSQYSSVLPKDAIKSAISSNKLKEIDWLYISLEIGYFEQTIKQAYLQTKLLSVEKSSYIPQYVEDVSYLLDKISDRCTRWGSEQCITMIHMRIFDFLDITEYRHAEISAVELHKLGSVLFQKRLYAHACRNLQIKSVIHTTIAAADDSESSKKVTPEANGMMKTSTKASTPYTQATLVTSVSPSVSSVGLSLVSNVFASTSSWLASAVDNSITNDQPPTNIRSPEAKTLSHMNGKEPSENMSFDEMLLSALELHPQNAYLNPDMNLDQGIGKLHFDDASIFVNAIGAIRCCINSMKRQYVNKLEDMDSNEENQSQFKLLVNVS
jgi:hypothetical protein